MNQQVKTRNLKKKNTKPNDIVDKKKQGLRNRETNVISFIFVALFLMMASYLVYFNVFEASTVVNNPYNNKPEIKIINAYAELEVPLETFFIICFPPIVSKFITPLTEENLSIFAIVGEKLSLNTVSGNKLPFIISM